MVPWKRQGLAPHTLPYNLGIVDLHQMGPCNKNDIESPCNQKYSIIDKYEQGAW